MSDPKINQNPQNSQNPQNPQKQQKQSVQAQDWQNGWWRHARRLASPNFNPRPEGTEISLVVLHSISLPPEQFGGGFVEDFFLNRLDYAAHPYFESLRETRVSAHFFLQRDGRVTQFVSSLGRAWHAGRSSWQGRENCNDYSIGVELEGSENQPFDPRQYAALWPLLTALCDIFPINAIAGHEHIAPDRKADPGAYFDWKELAGHFPDKTTPD